MSDGQKNGWNEQNVSSGAFTHLLERVSHQFAPNHGSQHYQSGFIPAATPPWSSHHQSQQGTVSYMHHSQPGLVMQVDPSVSVPTINQQVGISSVRSFSVSQEPYPEMVGDRTPLLRSSSDLGMRLPHYPATRSSFAECQLDGILDNQVESLNGSVFFTESSHLPQGHPVHVADITANFQHVPSSNVEHMNPQNISYSAYVDSDDNSTHQRTSSNFATKLTNFTASLGTWFSPLQQTSSYTVNPGENIDSISMNSCRKLNSSSDSIAEMPLETVASKIISQSTNSYKDTCGHTPVKTKPSYSDVLSKAPSVESRPVTNGPALYSKNIGYHSLNLHQKPRGESSSVRCGGKSKSRNSVAGRSNSPNASINNAGTSGKHKFEQNSSKVGLDNFYLPENISSFNNAGGNYSSYMDNLSSTPKSCNAEQAEKTKKRFSLTSEDSSPIHQVKKGTRSDVKKTAPGKQDDSPYSSDIEKTCDKLNNHTVSTQQKQTPKRTTFINNNLSSSSFSANSSKANNSESLYNLMCHRKGLSSKDETKFQHEGSVPSSNKNPAPVSSSMFTFAASGNNVKGSSRSNAVGSRSNRTSSTSKGEKSKEPANKKAPSKRRKEASPFYHSDLLTTCWALCLLWFGIASKAGFWLFSLVLDVLQMSWHLIIHFSLQLCSNGTQYWQNIKTVVYSYWTRVLNCFVKKKVESKKAGRNDRKSASGLETNIPLPTTGEEAMKRLLACRGKDPYSILGVTHDCTDDDIKKYYKRQAFLVHPDKNKQPGAEEAFKILAHAFEIIGEPERREQYDNKLAEEVHLEGAWGELASLLNRLKEKLEEAANTIRCTNCNKRHKRVKLPRPIYAARHCAECQIRHAAREGDIWAESWLLGLKWKYYACMEGAIYDISEWAACQKENLKHLQANTHSVQYRIVSGKKNSGGKNSAPECPTDPELEDFFNNLCRERFGQDFVPGSTSQSGAQQQNGSSDARKRRGKKKK